MKPAQSETPFTYPLVTIDFEASALTLQSYPIEVGIAIAHSLTGAIDVWSSLIEPDASWALAEQWDPDAEKIHGISRRELREGMSAMAVMTILNDLAPDGAQAWCDGGHYDAHWLAVLEAAAERSATFKLSDLGPVIRADPDRYPQFISVMSRSKPPHRAGPDAKRLCSALRETYPVL